jgi:hypothetical protein
MRGKTFGEVIEQVYGLAKLASNSSRGPDKREHVKAIIKSAQEDYYESFFWPFLQMTKEDATKSLAAGQRYYDFPSTLNQEHSFALYYLHGNVWNLLEQGIRPEDYSAFDSDNDQMSEPALKWDFHGTDQFEIWPMPSSNDKTVRFIGKKALTDLTNESDRLDLDHLMVAYSAASDLLLTTNKKLADKYEAKANERYWTQRRISAKDIRVRVGLGDQMNPPPAQTETGWPRTIAVYNG